MKRSKDKLTKRELKELEGFLEPWIPVARATLFLLAVAILAFILRGIQNLILQDYHPIWIVPTLILALLLYFQAEKWTGGKKFRGQLRRDVEEGLSETTIVEPVHIAKIAETEDEGEAFLIQDASGEHIFLSGQYLYPYTRRGFPWRRFEIRESLHARRFLGLKKLAEPIDVDTTQPPLPYSVLKSIGILNNDYVILTDAQLDLIKEAWPHDSKQTVEPQNQP